MRNQASARQRMIRRRLRRAILTGLGIIIVGLAAFGGYTFANSTFFDLMEIRLYGNVAVDRDELIQLTGLRIGANMLLIYPGQVRQSVLSHPFVRTASVTRSLPNRIDIEITERSPFVLVYSESRFLILDDEGYCMMEVSDQVAESWNLPRIRASHWAALIEPGERSRDEGVLAGLELIQQLDPFFMKNILEIYTPSAERLTLINNDGLPVLFGPPVDLERKLHHYEQLLIRNRDTINASTINYIDIRFDTQPTISWRNI